MSAEVRAWLAALRAEDPEVARLVGEAVTVLFEGGAALGPPLVMPLESVLRVENPGCALDHAYQRLLELQQRVRRGMSEPTAERERAIHSARRLQAAVDEFRNRKQAVATGHTAARAKQEIHAAFAVLGEPGAAGPADDLAAAQATVDDLLATATALEREYGDDEPSDVLHELRLESEDLRLLFGAESPDTGVLLVVGMSQDDWAEWYDEALPLARADLGLGADELTGYGLGAFLAEYFPGEQAQVRAAAARLIELNRPRPAGS
ncbi:hypothetical protein ACRYCC_23085 [Actinomadura scrupuli]|uniref:hypothetical protein n=1 Tax=Actinomadura scrupuli TaxID=559629 RepID=UPI003D975440